MISTSLPKSIVTTSSETTTTTTTTTSNARPLLLNKPSQIKSEQQLQTLHLTQSVTLIKSNQRQVDPIGKYDFDMFNTTSSNGNNLSSIKNDTHQTLASPSDRDLSSSCSSASSTSSSSSSSSSAFDKEDEIASSTRTASIAHSSTPNQNQLIFYHSDCSNNNNNNKNKSNLNLLSENNLNLTANEYNYNSSKSLPLKKKSTTMTSSSSTSVLMQTTNLTLSNKKSTPLKNNNKNNINFNNTTFTNNFNDNNHNKLYLPERGETSTNIHHQHSISTPQPQPLSSLTSSSLLLASKNFEKHIISNDIKPCVEEEEETNVDNSKKLILISTQINTSNKNTHTQNKETSFSLSSTSSSPINYSDHLLTPDSKQRSTSNSLGEEEEEEKFLDACATSDVDEDLAGLDELGGAQRGENNRLFTPDSLESSCSSCLSETTPDDVEIDTYSSGSSSNNKNNRLEPASFISYLNNVNEENYFNGINKPIAAKTTTTPTPTPIPPHNDTSIILEKIKKINQLQEKINDINNKIKHIDMNASISNVNATPSPKTSGSNHTVNDYYSLHQDVSFRGLMFDDEEVKKSANESENSGIHYYINPKYCDEEEEDEDDDEEDEFNQLSKNQTHSYNSDNRSDSSERHRNLNNKTRLGIRSNDNNHCDDDELEGGRGVNGDDFNDDVISCESGENYDTNETEMDESSHPTKSRIDDEYFDDVDYLDCNNKNDDENILYSSRNIRFVNKRNIVNEDNEDDDDVNVNCGLLDDEDDDILEDEDDDEDDLLFNSSGFLNGSNGGFKQAKPIHKKYASTGFLFHRFGGYLAPIDEDTEEQVSSSGNTTTQNVNKDDLTPMNEMSNLNNDNSDIDMVGFPSNNISTKGSASCFNLTLANISSKLFLKKISSKTALKNAF
jgi:hypothetical protein